MDSHFSVMAQNIFNMYCLWLFDYGFFFIIYILILFSECLFIAFVAKLSPSLSCGQCGIIVYFSEHHPAIPHHDHPQFRKRTNRTQNRLGQLWTYP